MTDLDALRPDVVPPPLREGLDRYQERLAFAEQAHSRLREAEAEFQVAATTCDEERAEEANRSLSEAQRVADATAIPDFDSDTAAHVRQSLDRVLARFREVGGYRPHEHVEARARLAPALNAFRVKAQHWSRTASPASEGVELLFLASDLCDQIDDFVAVHPPDPTPTDALAHPSSRPARRFIDLSNR
jgi:hypothetical protein